MTPAQKGVPEGPDCTCHPNHTANGGSHHPYCARQLWAENARLKAARDSADVDFAALSKALASGEPLPTCRSAGGIVIAEALAQLKANIAALVAAARGPLLVMARRSPVVHPTEVLRAVEDMGTVVNRPHPGASLLEEREKDKETIKALAAVTGSALGLSHAAHDSAVAAADCKVGMCPKYAAALRRAGELPEQAR